MEHIQHLRTNIESDPREDPKDLLTRVTGRFYAHGLIANHLIDALLQAWTSKMIKVVEPFCGDDHLVRDAVVNNALLPRAESVPPVGHSGLGLRQERSERRQ